MRAATRSGPSSVPRARRQPAAHHRGQRQAGRGLPGHGRRRRVKLDGREVVAALNAKPAAAALLTAKTYRGNSGNGVVAARARVNLSDFLAARPSVARGPFQQHLYRIGTHRDGTKPGVFLFCQQHAREWATGLTCLQTAHELVENYATDPQTKELLDNVEVFISPNSNPDGAHYSMYDSSVAAQDAAQLLPTTGASAPDSRTSGAPT